MLIKKVHIGLGHKHNILIIVSIILIILCNYNSIILCNSNMFSFIQLNNSSKRSSTDLTGWSKKIITLNQSRSSDYWNPIYKTVIYTMQCFRFSSQFSTYALQLGSIFSHRPLANAPGESFLSKCFLLSSFSFDQDLTVFDLL